jgi:hypothetical protein
MAICTRCHSSKPLFAPRCHACNEYTSLGERLLGNLFFYSMVLILWFLGAVVYTQSSHLTTVWIYVIV